MGDLWIINSKRIQNSFESGRNVLKLTMVMVVQLGG